MGCQHVHSDPSRPPALTLKAFGSSVTGWSGPQPGFILLCAEAGPDWEQSFFPPTPLVVIKLLVGPLWYIVEVGIYI